MTDKPDDGGELEVSDLRPQDERGRGADRRGVWRRWAPLALCVALLAGLAVSGTPQGAVALRWVRAIGQAPTPVTAARSVIYQSFEQPTPQPTTILRTLPEPPLGKAPADCVTSAPSGTQLGPPHWRPEVGKAPVLLATMSGAQPTLRLGPEARAMAFGWDAPYTQFGWPAPVGLALASGFNEPVALTGWNTRTGEPVSFGFVVAGQWGAPSYVASVYLLDPGDPALPSGGSDSASQFWYGYVFVPRAGCYTLRATWQGESWQATVSAGA